MKVSAERIKAAAERIGKSEAYIEEWLHKEARKARERMLGMEKTIRMGGNRSIYGTVVDVVAKDVRLLANGVQCKFQVTLEAPSGVRNKAILTRYTY